MNWVDLPLTGDPYRNIDESELDEISPMVIDGYVDELGYTQKRPGLSALVDLGTNAAVDGLFWWDQYSLIVAVSGGRVFTITDQTGTTEEMLGATLITGNRVTFSINGSVLILANGGPMVSMASTGPLVTMADGDAPTTVSHVDFLDGYTLALQTDSQRFWWSDNLLPLSWNASSQAQAQGAPDNLVAMKVGWREIMLAGPDSMEVWYDDGVSPFVRLNGGYVQRGISAPQSLQQVGGNWMWLDEARHFVKLDNRTPTIVSFPYNKQVQAFPAVNDAVSDVMQIDGLPLYVISFPSAQRTFAYNYSKDSWQDWGSWNVQTGTYDRFKGQGYAFARTWNQHLVGDTHTGIVHKASRTYHDDNGAPIRTVRRTGFVSHGTMNHKFSRQLRIRLKRGAGNASVADPQMFVRWRNNGGAWGNEHWLSLGQVGQHEYIAKLKNLGRYQLRQYEFGHADNSDFILIGAKELIEEATN